MRAFGFIVCMILLGFLGGAIYGRYFDSGPSVDRSASVSEASKKKLARKKARRKKTRRAGTARRKPREKQLTPAERAAAARKLNAGAKRFIAEIDAMGCALDPADPDLLMDGARYSMKYRLADGSQKTLEMSGTEYKAFGLEPAHELGLTALECANQGRSFKVDDKVVRVGETRNFTADQQGQPVKIRLDRILLVGPNASGNWVIHEISGRGVITRN